MTLRMLAAVAAGGLIGFERNYHGRPAGFRTHTLVCAASAMLMLVTVYEAHWMPKTAAHVQIDPTRMAQGIMTGIGFLGAGAIIKEGLSVRGLTTAASIWTTAAIGILAGIGFYFPLVIAVVLTLGVLSAFRFIEARMPAQAYYHFAVHFDRGSSLSEDSLRELVEGHGFSIANLSYRLDREEQTRRYTMVIRSSDRASAGRLARTLEQTQAVVDFRIAPAGD
ncbi:MAG TPA: MgtC/SapB family protein [Burkholderiales bacterium]|jgi:putative Mg2+ transporter-C (MgtC) family protein